MTEGDGYVVRQPRLSHIGTPLQPSGTRPVTRLRGPRFLARSQCGPEPRIRWARLPQGGAPVSEAVVDLEGSVGIGTPWSSTSEFPPSRLAPTRRRFGSRRHGGAGSYVYKIGRRWSGRARPFLGFRTTSTGLEPLQMGHSGIELNHLSASPPPSRGTSTPRISKPSEAPSDRPKGIAGFCRQGNRSSGLRPELAGESHAPAVG